MPTSARTADATRAPLLVSGVATGPHLIVVPKSTLGNWCVICRLPLLPEFSLLDGVLAKCSVGWSPPAALHRRAAAVQRAPLSLRRSCLAAVARAACDAAVRREERCRVWAASRQRGLQSHAVLRRAGRVARGPQGSSVVRAPPLGKFLDALGPKGPSRKGRTPSAPLRRDPVQRLRGLFAVRSQLCCWGGACASCAARPTERGLLWPPPLPMSPSFSLVVFCCPSLLSLCSCAPCMHPCHPLLLVSLPLLHCIDISSPISCRVLSRSSRWVQRGSDFHA